MENLWAVIKFPDEDDAVAAVPISWLKGDRCYWPPWSQDKVTKAIKNCTPPEDTWQTHQFLQMRNNIFESYDTAIKKVEKATTISDLDSQNELSSAEIRNEGSRRRRVVKTKLTKFASFELTENSDDETSHNLPEPPKLNGNKNRKGNQNVNEIEKISMVMSSISSDGSSTSSARDDGNNAVNGTSTSPELLKIIEYLIKIIRKQNIIQSTITDIAEDVNQLKNQISRKVEHLEETRESIFMLLKLPVESQIELDELEHYLSTEAQLNNAVKEICSSGGKDVYELIYRATGKLITNGFAAGFSYLGRQKKQKFSSLKINRLLIDSAVKTFECTEKDAELAISKWLRRCAERAKKEKQS